MNIVDTSAIEKLDQKLALVSTEKCHNIVFNAVKVGAGVLKRSTTQSLTSKMGFKATKKLKGRKVSLVDGVKMSNDKTLCEAKVYLTGYAGWFELGTAIRTTNKGYNRGRIEGINFFFAARQSAEANVTSAIANTIQSQLNKVLQ